LIEQVREWVHRRSGVRLRLEVHIVDSTGRIRTDG
jgi:UDP-N-acetylenolpyruvoylglucosamine reductase